MDLKVLLEQFNAKDEAELTAKRTSEKQQKVFSIKKPTPIALTQEQCQKMCDKIGVNYMPGYEHRVLQYIVSNETSDRYGDIVRAMGGNFMNYMSNPVMFFSHNYSTPPVGNSLKVWVDKQAKNVQAWGLFLDDTVDTTGLSDLVFRMAVSGFMKACSIGFQPIKANSPQTAEEREKLGLGKWGVEYQQWDMLEWSPCGIPANPTALQNTFKDIQGALMLEQRHIDAAAQFKLFDDVNLLDQFAEVVGRRTGKAFSLPEFGKSLLVKLDTVPAAAEPLTDEDFNVKVIPEDVPPSVEKTNEDKPAEEQLTNANTEPEAPVEKTAEENAETPEQKDVQVSPVNVNLTLDMGAFIKSIEECKAAFGTFVNDMKSIGKEVKSVQAEIKSALELIKQHNASDAQTDRKSLYSDVKIQLFDRPKI